jgi:hypothetical protein
MDPVDSPEQLLADLQRVGREFEGVRVALRDAMQRSADPERIAGLQADVAVMMELRLAIAEKLWNAMPRAAGAPRMREAAVRSAA